MHMLPGRLLTRGAVPEHAPPGRQAGELAGAPLRRRPGCTEAHHACWRPSLLSVTSTLTRTLDHAEPLLAVDMHLVGVMREQTRQAWQLQGQLDVAATDIEHRHDIRGAARDQQLLCRIARMDC